MYPSILQAKGIRVSAIVGTLMISVGTGIRCLQGLFVDAAKSGIIFKGLAKYIVI